MRLTFAREPCERGTDPVQVSSKAVPLRVLVAHDRGTAVRSAGYFLRSAGMQVRSVSLEEVTPQEIRADRPDVVLLAGRPDARSVAVARDLRDEAERPGIMFVVEGGEPAELCLADDYVPVDCTPAELVLRVEVLAARRALSSAATPLRAGRIWMERDTWQARVDGRPVLLTVTEFELLHLLASNPGQVVAKRTILDRVWQHGFEGSTNVVETYVSRLRLKLSDTRHSIIKTVRGIGYVLPVDELAA